MEKIKLSQSLEDYLEAIYRIQQSSEKVRAVDISRELNVSRASVTEALKKLDEMNLVNYGRYETLSLTESGKKEALFRHQIVVDFLYHLFDEERAVEWTSYLSEYLKKLDKVD